MNNTCILCPQLFNWYSIMTSTDIVKWRKTNDYKHLKKGGSREKGEEETKSMLHAPVLSPKIIEHKIDNDMWRWNRHKTVAGLNRLLDNILMWLSRKLLCWFITVYSHFIMTTKLNEVEGNTNSYDSYRWITLTSHG